MERAFQISEHSRVETDSTILKPGETWKGILGLILGGNYSHDVVEHFLLSWNWEIERAFQILEHYRCASDSTFLSQVKHDNQFEVQVGA